MRGKEKVLIGDEYELSHEIDKAYKAEIDRRLDEMKRKEIRILDLR